MRFSISGQRTEIQNRPRIHPHEADFTVIRVTEEPGLVAYDASYLWLAPELQAELITLDEALNAAATYEGQKSGHAGAA
jgi:predicted nucleic acid-binding protein